MSDISAAKLSELLQGPLIIDRLGELVPGLVYVFDLVERRNVYANQSLSDLLGYSPTEVAALGDRLLATIVHPDDLPRIAEHHARVQEALPGALLEVECRVRDAGGSFRWLHSWETVLTRDEQGRPRRLLGIAQEVTARVQMEQELRDSRRQASESEQRWRSIAENPFDFVVVVDRDYKYTFVNFVAPGLRREDLIGKAGPLDFVSGQDREVIAAALETVFEEGRPASYEVYVEVLQKWYASLAGPIREGDRVTHCSILTREITPEKLAQVEARRAEQQLRLMEMKLAQAGKLEAVGQLAGGIAHDFNNLLTGIAGVVEALADRFEPDDPSSQDVDDLRQAVQRGTGLTRQLLAFSRQLPVERVVLELNGLLEDTSRMLTRLIGESIELSLLRSPKPLFVRCDRTQLEQLLLNLAVNARDAMPAGGRLLFALEEVQIQDSARREHPDARPGRFAKLMVSDTGQGMDEATLSRIFEPFFTTKPIGAGTGLGLSMVHGIVGKAGGFIQVRTELSKGAHFDVYLPLVDAEAEAPALQSVVRRGGPETVLLVEDEGLVLRVTQQLLQKLGYRVETAARGDDALAMVQAGVRFDLLLTDVRLPGMDGHKLYQAAARLRRGLPVVFMSGYTDNVLAERGVGEAGAAFLQKPFSHDELAAKVRAALDAAKGQPLLQDADS